MNAGHLDGEHTYSFPSGYIAGAFAIVTMLMLRYSQNPEVYIPMFVVGRVGRLWRDLFWDPLSIHVLGGALVGTGSSYLEAISKILDRHSGLDPESKNVD